METQKEECEFESGFAEGFDEGLRSYITAKIKPLIEELEFNNVEEALTLEKALLAILKERREE